MSLLTHGQYPWSFGCVYDGTSSTIRPTGAHQPITHGLGGIGRVWIHVCRPHFAFTFGKCWDPHYKMWKHKLRKHKAEKSWNTQALFFSTHRFINPNACFVLFMDQALARFINLIRSCFILIDTHRFINLQALARIVHSCARTMNKFDERCVYCE